MVAVDAFSQALTNPLLSEHVWNEETFTKEGWMVLHKAGSILHKVGSMGEVLGRNVKGGLKGNEFIGMTQPGWNSK